MIGFNQKSVDDAEYIILQIHGGVGRNIMATAVIRNLKKAYPDKKIIIICGSPDIFLKNPHVFKIFSLHAPVYLYEDYVHGGKSLMVNAEPYQHPEYFLGKKHFVECWCEMLGIPCDSVYPEIYLSSAEERIAKSMVVAYDKPFVLCQFEGGKIPENGSEKERTIARASMYRRSISEKAQKEIAEALILRGFKVGVVAHENQYMPGGCERIFRPVRAIISLIPYTWAVISIDSFLMHGAAALGKKIISCWAGTNPIALGYDKNVNIRMNVCETPECGRPNSFMFDVGPSGYTWECPVNDKCCDYEKAKVMDEFDRLYAKKEAVDGEPKPEPREPGQAGSIASSPSQEAGGACPGEGCPGNKV